MKFSKDMLDTLLAKNDAELWQTITGFAASKGFALPARVPSEEQMKKLRSALAAPNISLAQAFKVLQDCKKS